VLLDLIRLDGDPGPVKNARREKNPLLRISVQTCRGKDSLMEARWIGSLVAVLGLCCPASRSAAEAADYVIESPDILKIEVTGLSQKAQPVQGEFLVRPDGTVSLGAHGSVAVSGLNREQVRTAIAKQLAPHARKKGRIEVRVEVLGYNSKVYFVILTGNGGQRVYRFAITGAETVVRAVLQVEGLAVVATGGHVWVSRPKGKTLDVDWQAITQKGRSATNHKLHPGDRVYVSSSPRK
jgi:polysaccharide biosynthesis/export protein